MGECCQEPRQAPALPGTDLALTDGGQLDFSRK